MILIIVSQNYKDMDDFPLSKKDIEFIIKIAADAATIIMKYYKNDNKIYQKTDHSYVTEVDKIVNNYLVTKLQTRFNNYPVVAEENQECQNFLNKKDSIFWVVDPIDGTDGYIKKNDYFTINIALIKSHTPIFGLIYLPVKNIIYYNDDKHNYRLSDAFNQIILSDYQHKKIILKSMQDNNSDQNLFREGYEIIKLSSAIKFCMLVENDASFYIRRHPTMEWDTAAGHAMLRVNGGGLFDFNGTELMYKKDKFLNQSFIATTKRNFLTSSFLKAVIDS